MEKKIYVASSWRNERQKAVVLKLRQAGFDVYDFKHPTEGEVGFHWSEIMMNWKNWTLTEYLQALNHSKVEVGFGHDWSAMVAAHTCVLVLPCGRSAHLEAGYFVGASKPLYILIEDEIEPELMYKMADFIFGDLDELTETLLKE